MNLLPERLGRLLIGKPDPEGVHTWPLVPICLLC